MKEKDIYKLHAGICKALAHPLHIEVIDQLKDKEMSFGEICNATGCFKSNLSQNLSSMSGKGILLQCKKGLNLYYKISSARVLEACSLLRELHNKNLGFVTQANQSIIFT